MFKAILGTAALVLAASPAFAQTNTTTFISAGDIQKVLKANDPSADHTIRVLDMGSYQLSIAVIHLAPARGRQSMRHPGLPRASKKTYSPIETGFIWGMSV
jgi:hypothetical protein